MCYFRRAQGVQLEVGIEILQLPEKTSIKGKSKVRMMSALQKQLLPSISEGLFDLNLICFNVSNIRFSMPRDSVEVTELAIGNAHVRSVDVSVDYPGTFSVVYLFFPEFISNIHQLCQRCFFEQENAFIFIQKLKIERTLVKVFQLHGAKVVT